MSRYTGPKARINRRLGAMVFENSGATRATDRRPFPPGMSTSRRKLSEYGQAMREKQKIKYYYGLGERHLRKLFKKANRQQGNTGQNLLLLCERRLDNAIRLAGFAKTRPQARQGVAHGHFLLNGRSVDVGSMSIAPGNVIQVKRTPRLHKLYSEILSANGSEPAAWLDVDEGNQQATVLRLPAAEDITLPVDVGVVVELLSR